MSDFKPVSRASSRSRPRSRSPISDGGVLRYRGVDITELVGHVPYEHVWGLLVDNDLDSAMPEPEPYEPARLSGNAPSDLQAETARFSASGSSAS